jgi:fucose 4-O-acetylase-like acetyltransferase
MKSRLNWVDIARGIGIITVLYGHAISGDSFRHIIYAFHMPLFFFLSGIVFNPQKNSQFFPFVIKNIRTILIPYLLFSVLSYGIWLLSRSSLPQVNELLTHMASILYGNSNGLFFNVVLWFLPCLFVTRLVFWVFTHFIKNLSRILFVLIGLSIISYIFSLVFPGIKLPFGIETAFTATVFYGLGYIWNSKGKKVMQQIQVPSFAFIGILLVVTIVFASINFNLYGYQIDMRLNRYSNYVFFYIAALSGISAVVLGSMVLKKNSLLEKIGKYSLPLFVWHIIIFTYLTQFTRLFISSELFTQYRTFVIAPIFTVSTTLLILAGSYLVTIFKTTLNKKYG